jgi:hypothetical protein
MPDERCAECDWALAELGERQPTPEVASRLGEHLAACPTCRQARDWDRRLATLLGDTPIPSDSTGIERRVHVLLGRRQTVRLSGRAATAAIILVCLGTAWWAGGLRNGPGPRPPVDMHDSLAAESLPLETLMILAAAPPVPALSHPQSAWLAVLAEASQGEVP